MKPLTVTEVTTPTSQRNRSATKHVHSIYRHLTVRFFGRAVSRLRARWVTDVLHRQPSSICPRENFWHSDADVLGTAIAINPAVKTSGTHRSRDHVDWSTSSTVPLRSRWPRADAELFARPTLLEVHVVPVRDARLEAQGAAAADRSSRPGADCAPGGELAGGYKRQRQRAGAARAGRKGPDSAVMRLDDAAGDRQRQSGSPAPSIECVRTGAEHRIQICRVPRFAEYDDGART